MTTDPATDRACHLLDWIGTTGPSRFTAREAFRGMTRSKFPKMTDLEPAVALLEQHGYIRRLPAPPNGARGGRAPSPEFEPHPDLIT